MFGDITRATQTRRPGRTQTVLPQTPCARSGVGLGSHLPTPVPEVSRPTPRGTESEAAVVLRRAEENDHRHVRGISSGEKRVHQGAPDAVALKIREDANRPHGNNWGGGDGRLARCNVPDHAIVVSCRERELGNDVARLPQRLEQTDLGWDRTSVLRRPKPRPPKSLRVDVPNRP